MKLFDTHTHLDIVAIKLDKNIENIWQRAQNEGVQSACQIGIDLNSSIAALELASKLDGIYASIGFHPSNKIDNDEIIKILNLAKKEKSVHNKNFVAIGEVGLDYHWVKDQASRKKQMEIFLNFLQLALELEKTLIIHCRPSDGKDALGDLLDEMKRLAKLPKIIMHCFAGDRLFAERFQELGCYLSFAGNVTFKNAANLQEALINTRKDRLLLETDAPYLAPGPVRGKVNEPSYLKYTYEFIKSFSNCNEIDSAIIYENSRKAFGLD